MSHRSFEQLAAHVLADRPLQVVDVGALWGLLPELEPLAAWIDAVGFDPDEAECEALEERARTAGRQQRFLSYAVTGRDGPRRFHVFRKEASSSLLPPNTAFHRRFPDAARMEVVRTVDVQTRALGPLLDELRIGPEFLKLDVHGVEGEILESLRDAHWDSLLSVHVELLLAEQYVGQTPFAAVHTALATHGFEVYDFKRYAARREGFDTVRRWTRGQVTMADALYLRQGERLAGDARRRLAVLAAVFGHNDVAAAELRSADDDRGVELVEQLAARQGRLTRAIASRLIRLGDLGWRMYGPPAGNWTSDQAPDRL